MALNDKRTAMALVNADDHHAREDQGNHGDDNAVGPDALSSLAMPSSMTRDVWRGMRRLIRTETKVPTSAAMA